MPRSLADAVFEGIKEIDDFRRSVDAGANGTDEDAAWGMLTALRDRFADTSFPVGVERIDRVLKEAEDNEQGTDLDTLWQLIEDVRGDYADALASIGFEAPAYVVDSSLPRLR